MISSQIDTSIGDKEFELLTDQKHMEIVWKKMQSKLLQYTDEYLEGVAHFKNCADVQDSFTAFLEEMIKKNDKLHDKYFEIFDMDLMDEEYSEDTEGFKGVILKKECDVIRKTLQKSITITKSSQKFGTLPLTVLTDGAITYSDKEISHQ